MFKTRNSRSDFEGGRDKVRFKVAGIVPFLVMKGMAMYSRMKEKDAYNIFYCIEQHPDGIEHLIAEFKPLMGNGLVAEGLSKIRSKFASIEHVGPKWVADFLEIRNPEDRAIIMRRAYERGAVQTSRYAGSRTFGIRYLQHIISLLQIVQSYLPPNLAFSAPVLSCSLALPVSGFLFVPVI